MSKRTKKTMGVLTGMVVCAGLAVANAAAAGPRYTATVLPLLEWGTGSVGKAVNNGGVVAAQGDNQWGQLVAFVVMNGVATELPMLPGGTYSDPWSINNSNVIVGECKDASNVTRPVKWELVDGAWTITDLSTLAGGAGFGVAMRINDSGAIIGYSTAANPGPYHACVWSGGTITDLGTLSYTGNLAYSQGLGISNTGHVCGFAYRVLGGPEHGMIKIFGARDAEDVTPPSSFGLAQWHSVNDAATFAGYVSSGPLTQGAFRPAMYVPGQGITVLPQVSDLPEGYGYDISNDGTIVGVNFQLNPVPEPNVFHGFVYTGGQSYDLNDVTVGLTLLITEATDVSDTGLIICTGSDFTSYAVLLTPAPEESQKCQPADIASDDGTALPTDTTEHPNNGVNEGDYNSFFQGFFDAARNCDIANDDGSPLPPFGEAGVNGGVNEGDYNCFFQKFFDGCPV